MTITIKTVFRRASAIAALGIAAGLSPAQAQVTGDDGATLGLEEVIVTAERREESIQDIAGVVQAFDGAELRADGITELRQLQLAVPGMNIANQEGNLEIFIRGVGSSNNTELGDPAAAPHVNGAYIPRPRGLGGMFYDLERVEVNKGPQGTLYGRNAMAGTLNLITARPSFDGVSGYVQGEYGSRDSFGFEGAVNLPINNSNAVRLAGYYLDRDYDYNNVGDQSLDPAGLQEDSGLRLSYLSDVGDRLSIFLMADWGREEGTGYPGSDIYSAVVNSGERAEDLDLKDVAYRGTQGELENDLWGIQGKVSYDLDFAVLEYSSSYREVDFSQRNAASDGIDYPGRDLAALDTDVYSSVYWETVSESQVHELRLVSDSNAALQWSVGAFYFDEEQESGFFSLSDKGYCCYSGTEFVMPEVNGESYAAFTDLTFELNETTRLFGGLRYTEEEKSRYGIGGNWALTLGGADFACCMATRLGTEGYVPAMLDRPNFDVSGLDTPREMAQFLIEGNTTPGARDTLIDQIGPIADGSNPNGNCFVRDDIDNGFITCPEGFDGGFSYANLTIPGQQEGESEADYVDWRIGVEFDLNPDSMLYAKVSTGHKSGGFNDSFDPGLLPETYDPEEVTVYELGSRNILELFDRQAAFNLTGFYYDYQDQVLQDLVCIDEDVATGECNGYSLANRNLGESEIWGVELETNLNFPANLRLDLAATFLDSEIKEGEVADPRAQDFDQGGESPLIDLSGNRLPLQSDIGISAKLSQHFDLGGGTFDWQVLVSYRSEYYLTQFNENDVVFLDGTRQSALEAGFPDEQEDYATVNLGLGYTTDGGWRVEGFATNLTDEEASVKAQVGSGLNLRFLNDARRVGMRVIKRF